MECYKIIEIMEQLHKKLPKFEDGRIDYTHSEIAPVITVLIKFEEEYLLLKRSQKVLSYKGKWANVGGYLDEFKPAKEKAICEVEEETGIRKNQIKSIKTGKPSRYFDKLINMTWIVQPFLIELNEKPEIKIDWEHEEYKWIKIEELKNIEIIPDLDKYFNYLFD